MLYMRLDTMNTTCVDRYSIAPPHTHFFFNICLQWVLAAADEIQFPDQESNPRPRRWEHGVLATGPPGKPLPYFCGVLAASAPYTL